MDLNFRFPTINELISRAEKITESCVHPSNISTLGSPWLRLLNSLLASSVLFISGCSVAEKTSNLDSIIGNDDRALLSSFDLKAKIGTINYKNRPICTAFASGKDEVTTAAHCLQDSDLSSFSVVINGKSFKPSVKGLETKADVMVLSVSGVNEYLSSENSSNSEKHFVVSFASDKNEFVVSAEGTTTDSVYPGLIEHTFATAPGASGSPLLQNGKVIGVHIGSVNFNGRDSNIAVRIKEISVADVSNIEYIHENWFTQAGG